MGGEDRRVYFLKGSPYDMGHAMGLALGPKLDANIREYTRRRMAAAQTGRADPAPSSAGMAWLTALPARFRNELAGLADGAGLPLQRVADWVYVEPSLSTACTAAVCLINGRAWVARNNDTYAPDMWGYVTVREPADRIPWISFCLEGDVFTPTGINRDRLWLHY